MKTWEDVVCIARDLGAAAGRKVVDVTDVARQKLKIAENERAIMATMEALGRLLYKGRKSGKMNEKMVEELVKQVDELTAANEELQAALDNAAGKTTCGDCGNVNPANSTYCNHCGKTL